MVHGLEKHIAAKKQAKPTTEHHGRGMYECLVQVGWNVSS